MGTLQGELSQKLIRASFSGPRLYDLVNQSGLEILAETVPDVNIDSLLQIKIAANFGVDTIVQALNIINDASVLNPGITLDSDEFQGLMVAIDNGAISNGNALEYLREKIPGYQGNGNLITPKSRKKSNIPERDFKLNLAIKDGIVKRNEKSSEGAETDSHREPRNPYKAGIETYLSDIGYSLFQVDAMFIDYRKDVVKAAARMAYTFRDKKDITEKEHVIYLLESVDKFGINVTKEIMNNSKLSAKEIVYNYQPRDIGEGYLAIGPVDIMDTMRNNELNGKEVLSQLVKDCYPIKFVGKSCMLFDYKPQKK